MLGFLMAYLRFSQPLILLGVIAVSYAVIQRSVRSSPLGIGGVTSRASARTHRRRDACFAGGLLAMLVALTGPIEQYADQLFWVHMTQHVLLLTVAAPLLALSAPGHFAPRLLKADTRRRAVASWRRVTQSETGKVLAVVSAPGGIWLLFNGNLLAFHIPLLYNATLRNAWLHELEHLLFLGLGVWFWAQIFDPRRVHARLNDVERAIYLVGAAAVGWALAIVLTFAPNALYTPYAELRSRPGGISALVDQQLAAGIMLVPGSITFLMVAGVALVRWLTTDEPQPASAEATAIKGEQ